MAKKKLIRDPRSLQLFSNEELGLPPYAYEYREIIKTDAYGRKVRQRTPVMTKEEFIRQAREIWGDAYDYSESVLSNMRKPVTIYCPKHQYHFRVALAQNHITAPYGNYRPTGCPICSYERQYGKEYGADWQQYLKVCKKNCRVGLIKHTPHKHQFSPEEIAERERKKEEAKAERERKKAEREKEEKLLMEKHHAKSISEARFKERVLQMYPNLDTSLVDYRGEDTKVTLICPKHGLFEITPRVLLYGERGRKAHGCWICSGLKNPDTRYRLTAKDFYLRVKGIYHAYPLTFKRKRKITISTKVTATCAKHGEQTHDAKWWLEGKGCEYCKGKFYPPDFVRLAHQAQGAEYQYRGVEKITSKGSKVLVHCGNPEHQWHLMRVWFCLDGSKCRECAGRHVPLEIRIEEFLTKALDKYGIGMFDLSRVTAEYKNNDTKIDVRCIKHNYWYKVTPDTFLRSSGGCPICNTSRGEMAIQLWLKEHGVPFKKEPIWYHSNVFCKRSYLKPDFYLPEHKLVIEYNGEQHYRDIKYFHKENWTFEDQQERDVTMRVLCKERKLRLLEISYEDYDNIDQILSKNIKI